ncbi:MAG: hypothetical protein HC921_08800 [Synechococcaceae cyanobacterium SM2_3_1]|nr:hypothetical protein [Synechococcaceae cyanobacterium SM2_3_1]
MNRKAIIRFLIFVFAIANVSYFYPLERGSRTVYSQGQDAILLIEDQVELNQIREAGCHPIQLGPPYTHPWEECIAIEVVATYVDAMNGDRPISGLAMMIISGKPPHTGATTQEAMVSMLTDEGWTGAVPLYPGAYDLETHAIDTVRPYSSDLSPYLQFLGDELTQK